MGISLKRKGESDTMRKLAVVLIILAFAVSVIAMAYARQTTTKTTAKKAKAKIGRGTAAVCPVGYVGVKHKKSVQHKKQYHPAKRTGAGPKMYGTKKTCPSGYVEKKMRYKKSYTMRRARTGAGHKCPVSGTYK